jgi:predicted RNA-binding Zn-ribbon protein involved in translation (DUF1610 family)
VHNDEYEDYYCPTCGGTEQWFDRSISYSKDGKAEGMTYRCVKCGISTDDWVKRRVR